MQYQKRKWITYGKMLSCEGFEKKLPNPLTKNTSLFFVWLIILSLQFLLFLRVGSSFCIMIPWFFYIRDHSFSTFKKLSEKLTFLTSWHDNVSVHIRGNKCYFFGKCRELTKWMITFDTILEVRLIPWSHVARLCNDMQVQYCQLRVLSLY